MGAIFNLAVAALLVATLYGPVSRELTILGVFRKPSPVAIVQNQGFHKIADTVHCEDLHYYGGKLFAACEDDSSTRFGWFPPLEQFKQAPQSPGSIHVIDPKTMKSSRLAFEGFSGPFVTHGIDITPDPENKNAMYIFAVNHLSNPEYRSTEEIGEDNPRARSQIELFHHVSGATTVKHIRSIQHELIKTPNDLYAESPTSLYITNDHYYRYGIRRLFEDVIPLAKWSSIVHVQIKDREAKTAQSGIDVSVALSNLHNNNGLGHGKTDEEIVIASAASATLHFATANQNNHTLSVSDSIPLDSVTDNPNYFKDPYATSEHDASGYVVAGISRPIDLPVSHSDPAAKDSVIVWYVKPTTGADGQKTWEKRVIFEDDGSTIRSASAAVLVPIEPKKNEPRKAWLFVTGFMSESMIAVQVDL